MQYNPTSNYVSYLLFTYFNLIFTMENRHMSAINQTTEITIVVTPQAYRLLQELLQTGFYGTDIEQTTERILSEELRRIKEDNIVENLRSEKKEGD